MVGAVFADVRSISVCRFVVVRYGLVAACCWRRFGGMKVPIPERKRVVVAGCVVCVRDGNEGAMEKIERIKYY